MSYKLYSDEEKRLQRKLIPLNIVIALIALIAAVSLIITPLVKINLGKAVPALMDLFGGSSASEEGEGNAEGEGGGEGSGTSQYAVIFENIDADIVLAPLDMFKVLIAPQNEKGSILLNKLLIENGLFERVASSLINLSLATATKAIQSVEDLEKLDITALNEALTKIDNAKSEDDVKTALNGYLTTLEGQLEITLTEDMKKAAEENTLTLYNKTVEATGGSFSVEKMICVNMSPEGGEAYTSYTDLMTGMMNGSSDDATSGIAEYAQMLNVMAAPYGYMFFFIAYHVLMWFILFLFAFFRTFAKNKRFTMWYVKLVSCWPCIIFFLAPFVLGKFGGSIAAIAPYVGLFGAITSMTWISGICYLLLWLFSICWAFPIKRKIRRLRKGK